MTDDYTNQRLWELGNTGVIVEEDVLGIVAEIRKMDPNLDVQFLDPDSFPELTDAPYRIIEYGKTDRIPRVVFTTWTLDKRVLDRLRMCDTLRNDVLGNLDTANLLAATEKEQRWQEIRLEAQDVVAHGLRSPKGRWSFKAPNGETVTIDDDPNRRPTRK